MIQFIKPGDFVTHFTFRDRAKKEATIPLSEIQSVETRSYGIHLSRTNGFRHSINCLEHDAERAIKSWNDFLSRGGEEIA